MRIISDIYSILEYKLKLWYFDNKLQRLMLKEARIAQQIEDHIISLGY